MEFKPIQVKCPCCEAILRIEPTHPKYHEYRMELMREAHPEVSDSDDRQDPDIDNQTSLDIEC